MALFMDVLIIQNVSSQQNESTNNTLPSYAMLHLMYKISKAPKNKK